MNPIEIPLSKTKLLLGIVASIIFVVLSFFLFTTIAEQQTRFSPVFAKSIGIVSILLFSITGVYGMRKLFDKRAGLIISDGGIIDNTSATSIGLIKWSEIILIQTEQVMSTKFLLIHITNPDNILEKVSGAKRKLMAANMKVYGTPLLIASTTLKYNFNDLKQLLIDKLLEYREKSNTLL